MLMRAACIVSVCACVAPQAREAWSKPRQAVVITACGLLQPGEQ